MTYPENRSMFKVQGSKLPARDLELGTWNLEQRARIARARGFTMIEMVTVIAIMGLLAAVIGPRFVGRDAFASRGFYDEAQSVVRYAQKTAIAWRRPVFVCVTATAVSAGTVSGCGTLLVHPVTGAALSTTSPSGVTLTPSSFGFDGAGRPNPNAQVTIAIASTIAGDPARQIVVEAETGYVHP